MGVPPDCVIGWPSNYGGYTTDHRREGFTSSQRSASRGVGEFGRRYPGGFEVTGFLPRKYRERDDRIIENDRSRRAGRNPMKCPVSFLRPSRPYSVMSLRL
jgi:hypothetical protein